MKTQRAKIIHAGHINNPRRIRLEDNTQGDISKNPFFLNKNLEAGEGSTELNHCTTFQTSPVNQKGVMYFNKTPQLCDYQKEICPSNIHKYTMKCLFNKNTCRIKKYFDKWRIEDLDKLGIGGFK